MTTGMWIAMFMGMIGGAFLGRKFPSEETVRWFQNEAVRWVLAELTERSWTCAENLTVTDIVVERDSGRTRMIVTGAGLGDTKPGDTVALEMGSPTPYDSISIYGMKFGQILRVKKPQADETPLRRPADFIASDFARRNSPN